MKRIGSCLFGCLTLVLAASICAAQVPEKPSPTPEDYEQAISAFKKVAEKSFKVEAWKDQKVVNNETNDEKKFGELLALEQHVLLLDLADNCSHRMLALQQAWDLELKKFANPMHKLVPRAKIDNQKQNPAVKADVETYHKELLTLRKNYAVAYEKFVEKFVKDFSKEIDKKEAKMTLDDIRSFHDKNGLIERLPPRKTLPITPIKKDK